MKRRDTPRNPDRAATRRDPRLAIPRLACGAVLALVPTTAAAHPHIFVDTGVTFVVDDANRLASVRVTWAYDALYSLLILEERGLDPDFDGVLTDQELDRLRGFDLNWIPGFEGDTYLSDGTALLPPGDPAIAVEDGRIVSTHSRRLATPVPLADPLTVKAYDPTYYTAYSVTRGVEIEGGAGCAAEVRAADLDAAYTLLEEYLYGPRRAEFSEDSFPEVGEAFADAVVLRCAGRS